jgi:alcohol dehydrogenase class IV
MRFSFATAGNILFGTGIIDQAGRQAARLGKRVLLVTGRNPRHSNTLIRYLADAGLVWFSFSVGGEPRVEQIAEGVSRAVENACDLVIGMGGGSALDAAKAIAALVTNTRPIETYLEVIGEGQPLDNPPLPCVAIPTTAGTGCEVTRNAVLLSVPHQVKVSLRGPEMLPDLALVDPELTLCLPPDITAYTGCDALTQLLESFVSSKANPFTDALCREGLPKAAAALPSVVENGDDLESRTRMSLASLFSGLTLANAGLGAVHGIAGPLGGMIQAPHGALCAALLPYVWEANLLTLQHYFANGEKNRRFIEAARLLTGDPQADADAGLQYLFQLTSRLKIPPLAHWGLEGWAVPGLVRKAQTASSMKGNPVNLSDEELTVIIEKAMGT